MYPFFEALNKAKLFSEAGFTLTKNLKKVTNKTKKKQREKELKNEQKKNEQ